MDLGQLYLFLQPLHYWLSRVGLAAAVVMFGLAVYIGILRKGDVTRLYRRVTYGMAGLMGLQAVTGALMYYVIGARPVQEVHLIYGLGSVLALPFFIFVEVTAKKRPAMGSYIWGYAVLAGVLLRSIVTGPPA